MRIVGPTQFVLKTSLMKSADVSSIGSSGNQQQMQRRLSFCPATLQGGSAATAGYVRAAPMPALLTKTSTLSTFLASSLAKVEIDVSLAWSRVILCSLSPYSACGISSMQRPLSTTSCWACVALNIPVSLVDAEALRRIYTWQRQCSHEPVESSPILVPFPCYNLNTPAKSAL